MIIICLEIDDFNYYVIVIIHDTFMVIIIIFPGGIFQTNEQLSFNCFYQFTV